MTDKPNVYECIAKCAQEIATTGISKDRSNSQQGYKFRGIDDVYNTLAPIISRNGLVILPRVLDRSVVERPTKDGKGVLFYTTVESEFDLVSMYDGSKHTIKTYGEAMDSGDKSTNKAMSAAYKYACMQAFCIPTEGDNDADQTTHEIGRENKFTPENKSLQAVLFTELAQCADRIEIESFMDEYKSQIESLPQEMSSVINDQIEVRLGLADQGKELPKVTAHAFCGVDDSIAWMTKMKPVVDGFKTPEMLIAWQKKNQPYIEGLSILKAEKYKKEGRSPRERFLDALAVKLGSISQAPIG